MLNNSAVLVPGLSDEVLTSALVKAADAPTDEARQRAVRLCEEAAAVLGMPESVIAACKRAATAKVAIHARRMGRELSFAPVGCGDTPWSAGPEPAQRD